MKKHYTCTDLIRGNSKPRCLKKIEARRGGTKTLKASGWQHNGNYKRDHWRCPNCKQRVK